MANGKLIITVSGMPGSGKTTVSESLAEEFDLEYYSIGSILREMADKRGISITEMNKLGEKDTSIDRELDDFLVKLGNNASKAVIDGRLGFHFVPHSIKILLKCDPKEAARRIFSAGRQKEKYQSLEQAEAHVRERLESEEQRYKKYYGVNITDEGNFDIIYDTTNASENECAVDIIEEVYKFLKHA